MNLEDTQSQSPNYRIDKPKVYMLRTIVQGKLYNSK